MRHYFYGVIASKLKTFLRPFVITSSTVLILLNNFTTYETFKKLPNVTGLYVQKSNFPSKHIFIS
jgi:hypothetical protein